MKDVTYCPDQNCNMEHFVEFRSNQSRANKHHYHHHQQQQPISHHFTGNGNDENNNILISSSNNNNNITNSSTNGHGTSINNINIINNNISTPTTPQQCVGCGNTITDQFVLKVAPDSVWHSGCLKCFQCQSVLDENCTCFIKDGLTYCKDDYVRLFGAKCSSCSEGFLRSDLVMKARSSIFHLDCFKCSACNKKLVAGDEFSINDNNDILCKDDHQHHLMKFSSGFNVHSSNPIVECDNSNDKFETSSSASDDSLSRSLIFPPSLPLTTSSSSLIISNNNNNNQLQQMQQQQTDQQQQQQQQPLLLYPLQTHNNNRYKNNNNNNSKNNQFHHHHHHHHKDSHHHHHHHHHKTTRIRTVLNEKQLHTLRTCYSANSRPDALMKEQLVEMTGLSPRVIRVWFQNKRCKDKKRSIVLKQLQQQNQNKSEKGYPDDSWFNQKAVALIATSPIVHDPPVEIQPTTIEIEKCPTPYWLELSQSNNSSTDVNQFVNQSGYRIQMTPHESTNQDDDTVVSFDDVSESLFTPGNADQNNG